jgi:hypothetical protein
MNAPPLGENWTTVSKPTLVAIYARVSTSEQNPEAQLLALREYAARRGFSGRYTLKRDWVPEPLDRVRVLRMPPRSELMPAAGKIKKSVTI